MPTTLLSFDSTTTQDFTVNENRMMFVAPLKASYSYSILWGQCINKLLLDSPRTIL